MQDLLDLLLLWWVRQCPFSSASDLEKCTDFGASRVTTWLQNLFDHGFIGKLRVGSLLQAQDRFYLQQKGFYHLIERLRLEMEWPDTEAGLVAVRRFLPIAESLYPLSSRLFSIGAVDPLPVLLPAGRSQQSPIFCLDQDTKLELFRWLRSGKAAVRTAIGDYRTTDGHELQIVFVWQGLQHRNESLAQTSEEVYDAMKWIPDPLYGGLPRPAGLVIVVPDQLGALRVQTQLEPAIPFGIVDQEQRVIRPMQPAYPQGWLLPLEEPELKLGRISLLPNRIAKDPGLAQVSNVPTHRALRAVELIPRLNQTGYGKFLKANRQDVAKALTSLKEAGLIKEYGGLYELDNRGQTFVARLDRTSLKTVRGRYRTGNDQPLHKRGLARIALRFRQEGIDVAPEWRFVCNIENLAQVKPDLWVLIPRGDGTFVWYAVEYERNAQTETQWPEKQDQYRAFLRAKFPIPCLMICETSEAARVCENVGSDLPMLVCTYKDFLGWNFGGEESIWRHNGAAVDMSYLPKEPAPFLVTNTREGAVAYH